MLSQWCHSLLAWQPLLEGEWGMQEPSLPEARGVPKRRSPLCSRLESSSACLRLSWAAPCTRWDRFFLSVSCNTEAESPQRWHLVFYLTNCSTLFLVLQTQTCLEQALKKLKKKKNDVSLLITLFKVHLLVCVAVTALEKSVFCGPNQWLNIKGPLRQSQQFLP